MDKILTISNEEYQAIEAMSFTAMKEFLKSPAHFMAYKKKPRTKSTSAQIIGTAVHAAILEPDTFESKFTILDGHRGSKAVKEQLEYYEAAGIQALTTEQMDSARFARDAVLNHPVIRDLLTADGIAEGSIVTEDVESGAPIKCRPDFFIPDAGVILDLKTFDDLRDRSVERQITQQAYDLQAIHYLNVGSNYTGKSLRLFGNIFIEIDDPYGVRMVGISDASLEKAHEKYKYRENLLRYKGCLDSGQWPNYDTAPYNAELFF